MTRKIFCALLLVMLLCSVSSASPVPPSKGQWAYPTSEYALLYSRADLGASNQEIEIPEKWISVPSATRDSNNYLWYSVNIDGRKGWLPQNGIRLKMGGKSKIASNLYKTYVQTRNRIMNKPGRWTERNDGDTAYYRSEGGEFRVRENGSRIEDLYFSSDDRATCKAFFGTDIIGMYQTELRKKLGTPTMRESPYDDINTSILSYELSDRNMTLAVTMTRDEGDNDGHATSVELYYGRAGEPEY